MARGWCMKHYLRWYQTKGRTTEPYIYVPRICSIDGCQGAVNGRELCNKHYLRWWIHGTTADPTPSASDRFWSKVEKSETCWLWTGAKINSGYGLFSVNDRRVLAHRFAYELLIGPIPAGLTVDHLCYIRACIRPDHLEAVTMGENTRRARLRRLVAA